LPPLGDRPGGGVPAAFKARGQGKPKRKKK
jgi:hypothetical protein